MDHRVSGDNRIHYHGHHLYAVSFTGLSWGNPVCRSGQTQQVGIHSSLTVSWSRLMVGRSSCGGRVSVIFSGGPDHKPIRAQTWMRLTNQEGLVYSTVTLLYCTVVRGNVMLCFTPGQDDQPEEDFHQDQEPRSLPVIMFGWRNIQFSLRGLNSHWHNRKQTMIK